LIRIVRASSAGDGAGMERVGSPRFRGVSGAVRVRHPSLLTRISYRRAKCGGANDRSHPIPPSGSSRSREDGTSREPGASLGIATPHRGRPRRPFAQCGRRCRCTLADRGVVMLGTVKLHGPIAIMPTSIALWPLHTATTQRPCAAVHPVGSASGR
jgi:hypothetical protein